MQQYPFRVKGGTVTTIERAYVTLREGPRIVSVKAGFHLGELGKQYGCGGDQAYLTYMVTEDYAGSIGLNVDSVRGEPLSLARTDRSSCTGLAFGTHRGFPIRVDEVHDGMRDCEFLAAGECYGDVGYLRGDHFYPRELRDPVAEEFLRSDDYEEHAAWILRQEPMWGKIEAESRTDEADDRANLVVPCSACHGKGVA